MIVDKHNGVFALFDGAHYSKDNIPNNSIYGQNVVSNKFLIQKFICIIHFGSKYTYTIPGKKDTIRKEATSIVSYFPKILVKTKKISQKTDMFASVFIEKVENNVLYCDVCEYLGNIDDKNVEDKLMEYSCTIQWKNIKKYINIKDIDLTPNRTDLTHINIYSIDPYECKDIDDALHCIVKEQKENSITYEIGIHIADVSSYIKENSELDIELQQRSETIYVYNKAPIHMIPGELSIETISLMSGSKKRAFSFIFDVIVENDVVIISNIKFIKTFVNVINLTYDQAQKMNDAKTNIDIINMYNVGIKLGNSLNHKNMKKYDSHEMVAIYMIFANKTVAETLSSKNKNNILLRCHNFKQQDIYNVKCDDDILYEKYNMYLMEQAKYQIGINNDLNNCGHRGLDLQFYTHMTSPIRRYADIIIHRQLWNAVCNDEIVKPSVETVFLMNFNKRMTKKLYNQMHIIEIANFIKSTDQCYITEEAYIIFINDINNSIRLYIKKFNLDYDLKFANYKNMQNLKLFENVKVKIISTQYNCFTKLLCEII